MGIKRIIQKEIYLNSNRGKQIKKMLKNVVANAKIIPQRVPSINKNRVIFCLSENRITNIGQFSTTSINEFFKTRNPKFKASYYEIWDKVNGTKQDYSLNRMYFHIYKVSSEKISEYILLHTDPADNDATHGDYKRSPHIHIKETTDSDISHAHLALNITDFNNVFSDIETLNSCFSSHIKMIANQVLKI